jgi:PAS domain S-box-containing protein
MISANAALPGFYDYGEVARSVLIAIAASYAALDLAGRVTAASGRVRLVWLSGGAIAMGIGIWAMHFKGMLALRLPVPVEYHWPLVLASLLVAILASGVALYVASCRKIGVVAALTGSIFMATGIAGMHYIGMAAMRLPAITRYSPLLVTCSILLAILFSLIALLMAFDLREETRWSGPRRLGSATVMGVAVSAMHYTGMAAASFIPASPPDLSHAVTISPLANNGIATVTLIVIVAAITTSSVDRRRNEGHLRLVIDTAPAMLHSARTDGYVDFFNKRWLEYVGASLEEISGWRWTTVIHPEDVENVVGKWRSSVATGRPFEAEGRLRRADGEYRLMLLRKVPLRDEAGSIVKWYGSAIDIEERKRAEQELRQAEEHIRAILEYSPNWIFLKDTEGRYLLVNREIERVFGISQEQIRGKTDSEIFPPEQAPEYRANDLKVLRAGLAMEFEETALLEDGPHTSIVHKFPLFDTHGNIYASGGVATDITERKRAEEARRYSEEQYRTVVETATDAVVSIDEDSKILFVNPATTKIFGYDTSELIGRPLMMLMPESLRKLHEAGFRRYLANGERHLNWQGAELTALRKNGQEFQVEVSFGEMTSNGHKVFTGFIHDISEKKRAEEHLRQAQEDLARVTRVVAMGELAAAIAHEVNQPLTAIVTNGNFSLRQLESATPNPDELRAAITEIVSDGTRASAVISRIRGLLMKGTPMRAELNINQIIHDVGMLLRNDLSRNHVSLRTDLAADLPRVPGDSVQLQQVLINLIMNAVEAMRTSTGRTRELLIRSAKNTDGVLVQVQDSGPGMEPEVAARIFEPFFTTKAEGIGMGLSISRSIVESHGGRLWAVAEPNGALFEFTVPTQD